MIEIGVTSGEKFTLNQHTADSEWADALNACTSTGQTIHEWFETETGEQVSAAHIVWWKPV